MSVIESMCNVVVLCYNKLLCTGIAEQRQDQDTDIQCLPQKYIIANYIKTRYKKEKTIKLLLFLVSPHVFSILH